jgi:DNA-binding XRE family transcriptional regulator
MKNNLQALRWEKGLSQQSLSLKSGVSKSTICKIENDVVCNPSIDIGYKLSKALNIDITNLFIPDD